MSSATSNVSHGGSRPGRISLVFVTAVFAVSPVLRAGEDDGHLTIRHGTSELRFVRAYEPGKVPVVFVHGLLGSPGNWSTMIDRLSSDPAIRDRFQLATFRYDS